MSLSILGVSVAIAQSSGWVARPEAAWRKPTDRTAGLPREIEFRAAGEGLERIEAGRESLQDGRIQTEPISGILVRLKPAVVQMRSRPGREAQGPAEAERNFVEAHLMVVTGGKISAPGIAQCRQFEGDVLICSIECEGGAFGLRRGREPGEHYLVLGVSDPDADRDRAPMSRPGFRLSSCGAKSGTSLLFLPRAGRLATEVRLLETR